MARLGMVLLLAAVAGACDPAKLRHTPDAKPIDGAPDAVPHGQVTVKVYDPNTPGTIAVGIPVVFVNPDGTIVGHPVTDANGVAMADVEQNASATAVIATANQTSLTTIAGLQPNDSIILNQSQPQVNGVAGTFSVSFPAYPGSTYYYVYGPCGNSYTTTTSVTMNLYSYCKPQAQAPMDLMVVAFDANGVLANLEKTGVPYTNGGNTSISGTYSFPTTFNANYTNIDPTIGFISMRHSVPANNGYSPSKSGTPMNNTLAVSVPTIQGATGSVQTQVSKGLYFQFVQQNIPGSSTNYGLDVGATLLPWIGQPMIDLDKKKVSVPTDTTGTSKDKPDFFYLQISYSRPNGSNGTSNFNWLIISPEIGDVQLPPLPPEIGDVLPKPMDNVGFAQAIALESTALTWDMIRTDAFDIFNTLGNEQDTTTKLRESFFQNGD